MIRTRYFETDGMHPVEVPEHEARKKCWDEFELTRFYTVVKPDQLLGYVIHLGGKHVPRSWVLDELQEMLATSSGEREGG